MLVPANVGTSQGVATFDEYKLHVILEAEPGTPDLTGTPIVCTDIASDFQNAEDWITHRSQGFKEDNYSAVIREWTTISGALAPDYALMVWKALCIFGLPVITETGNVVVNGQNVAFTEYEFRLPSDSRVDRAFVTGEWGRDDSAFRAARGMISAMTINSARTGTTDGNITMMFKKGDKGLVKIGAGANEVANITATGIAGPSPVVIPDTPLGAGGNLVLNANQTAAQIRTLLAAIPAIRNASNVRVTGGIDGGGNGVVTIEFVKSLALRNIPPLTTAATGLAITPAGTAGSRTPIVPFEPRPILPGDWKVYTAKTRAALDALGEDDNLKTVETHSIEYGDLVGPHWVEDGNMTYEDHVDGVTNVNGSLAMEYDDDPTSECFLFDQEAHNYIAIPRWLNFVANCRDGVHRAEFGLFGSARDATPFGNEGNVYRKTFPFSRKANTNPGEGYSAFIRLRVPTV